jgi:hypothetical protein
LRYLLTFGGGSAASGVGRAATVAASE